MRKTTVILFLTLILSLGGTCFAAVKLWDSRDEVTLTEVTSWGNKEATQDLKMQTHIMYQDRLFWNTTVFMDNPEEAVTECKVSLSPIYADLDKDTGLSMDLSIDTAMISDNILQGNIEGITKAYAELADTIGSGEEAEKEIYLKDYIDYYQYMISLKLPGTDIYRWRSIYKKGAVQKQAEDVIETLSDFFKIPVLEDESCYISVGKNEQGNIYHTGSGTGENDFFYMQILNAIGKNKLYFTFDTHSRDGVVVDTSLIPGGYGIYMLPFDSALEESEENADRISVNAEGLKMVYALDPQINVKHLHMNEKKDKLILHAEEYGKYVVTVIDSATMNTLQKIEVMDWNEDYAYQIYEKDNFFVNMVHKTQEEGKIEAAVFVENENGEYEIAFIREIQNKNIPSFNTSNLYLDFDGKRLAMAGFLEDEKQYYRTTCNIFVAVCDAAGMQYYGEYRNSLETGYDEDNYYYHCQGYGLEPIVLKWKE